MPISPDAAAERARAVLEIVSESERRILEKVKRRLARGIDEVGWAETKLFEIRELRKEIVAEIRRMQLLTQREIVGIVFDSYNAGVEEALSDLRASGSGFARGSIHRVALDLLIREAVDGVRSTEIQILRSSLDIYRKTIGRSSSQVLTGTLTRREAAQRALIEFGKAGITGFVDRAGRHWELPSYAEMSVRTTSGRAAVQGHLDRLSDNGQNLVIVSDAPGECPVCRPWEGRVLRIGGQGRQPTVEYATAQGLFHANCRHSVGLYLEGFTPPFGKTADPAGFEARTQQRYLERGVRSWKRREVLSMNATEAARSRAKVREWQSRLRNHVAQTGGKRLSYREQIGRAV